MIVSVCGRCLADNYLFQVPMRSPPLIGLHRHTDGNAFCRRHYLYWGCLGVCTATASPHGRAAIVQRRVRRRRHRPSSADVEVIGSVEFRTCPGCTMVMRTPFACKGHMNICCPMLVPEYDYREVCFDRAHDAIVQVEDDFDRRLLTLRFGLDQKGVERTPIEVGEVLGLMPQDAFAAIRAAFKRLPLVPESSDTLEVLHEDDNLVVVNKPPGVRCSPLHRFNGGSVLNMVAGHLLAQGKRPFPAHTIDATTSGIFVIAKDRISARILSEEWHSKSFQKKYLAIVERRGDTVPAVGAAVDVDAALGQVDNRDYQMRVETNGKSARTRFCTLASSDRAALLACSLLESGRTHQIRVHAQHAGFPILADWKYGASLSVSIERPALHAWRLQMVHPTSKSLLRIEATPPEDFANCMKEEGLRNHRVSLFGF